MKNSLIAIVEIFCMIIYFFSLTQLIYGKRYPDNQDSFNTANIIFAVIFLCLITIYTCARMFFNLIGGVYMLKRILIPLILVGAYNNSGLLALLILMEVFFFIVRYLI
jgi:hypothetical protein